jgi:hypothetical protein
VNWERDARLGVSGLYFLIATWLEQPITLIGRVDILWHSGHSSTNHCTHMRSVWWRAVAIVLHQHDSNHGWKHRVRISSLTLALLKIADMSHL